MRTPRKLLIAMIVLIPWWCANDALAQAADDGRGVDHQTLWPAPGPSNFATLLSSDVVENKSVAFSTLMGYHRNPIGLEFQGDTFWIVENAFTLDLMWAFGIIDIFQLGFSLPLVLEQNGVGLEPIQPEGTPESDYMLSSSALRDMRFNLKARILGGKAEIPDQRDFGLAFDLGVAVPTGDEMSFAGDGGVVMFPTAIVDFHRCMFSAANNLGARLRFDQDNTLFNLNVGHQGAFGLGVTGHFLKRRLLASAEMTGLVELDGFDRVGVEYRGTVGYIPDENRAITLWTGAGSSFGTGDLLGTPAVRALLGLTFSPKPSDPTCCDYLY
jgi:hypothetical protein